VQPCDLRYIAACFNLKFHWEGLLGESGTRPTTLGGTIIGQEIVALL
jgi:hypothetical protein